MIIPHRFIAGTKAKAQEVNENFDAVNDELSQLAQDIASTSTSITANLNSQVMSIEEQLTALKDMIYPIGSPIAVLSDSIGDDEIWLEGQEVSKSEYAELYAVYGTTYGEAENTDNFKLPDFTNRVMWGASEYGYVEAGLPNITGTWKQSLMKEYSTTRGTGALAAWASGGSVNGAQQAGNSNGGGISLDASLSNSIYGNSTTVQPPAVNVRVKTRYR